MSLSNGHFFQGKYTFSFQKHNLSEKKPKNFTHSFPLMLSEDLENLIQGLCTSILQILTVEEGEVMSQDRPNEI